ncbi:MAG: ATP-binding protein [Gammaproteobacteria bacterium]
MSEFLWQTFHRLIDELPQIKPRFLYQQMQQLPRLTGIVGPRGVGKTTLLLQYLKNHLYESQEAFYFSADNTYFNETTLLEFVDDLYSEKNIRIFFIDEIHKYPNWNQELKNIYDSFPKLQVVFSGSSSIDLITGSYDLSRRAKLIHMPGLSFREFINIKTNNDFPAISLQNLLKNHQKFSADISKITTIKKYFEEYMLFGYYPMVFQDRDNLYEALGNIIDKMIYEDIASFYQLKTTSLKHFKRILNYFSSIPPGEIKTNNLARRLNIDNKTVDHYLTILENASMIKTLHPVAKGSQVLTKPSKCYLDNTTMHAAINTFLSEPVNLGAQRELVFLQFLKGAGIQVFYPSAGDFQIKDIIFEIGGKNKKHDQLKSHTGKKYIVKDNILMSWGNEIPLYLFGFLY